MANVIKVKGEQVFQIEAPNFAISPSASGYTLNYSADGVNFTAWDDATAIDTTQVVACGARGMYYKLVGNTADVIVTY